MKTCPNCGASLPEGGGICLQCGAEIASPAGNAFSASPSLGQQPPPAEAAPLFTPTFAAESGGAPGYAAPSGASPSGGLPTGKEAEDLVARALADSGPSLLGGDGLFAPVASPAPPLAEPQIPAQAEPGPAPLFEGTEVPLTTATNATVDPFAAPAGQAETADPFDTPGAAAPAADLFAQPEAPPADGFAADAFGADAALTDAPEAGAPLLGGDTAEFALPENEAAPEASRQVFPTRQYESSGQTIPYESQQGIGNLFEDDAPTQQYYQPPRQQQRPQPQPQPQQPQQPQQRYPQQDQRAQQQYYSEAQAAPARRGAEENNRAAMVANIAQAAGADEEDRQRPRPMAGDRDLPRPQAPTRRAPARPPRPAMEEDWPPPRKGGAGRVVRNVLLIVLLFLVATFLATVGLLYYRNRPAATIEDFAQAVSDRDYNTLSEMVSLNDAPADSWEAFCDAFAQEEQLDALRVQLAQKPSSEDDLSGLTYQAVTLESETLFLFINKYYVCITGIEFLAPGAAEGTGLEILGATHSGTPTDEGVLYGKFMPGLYSCRVLSPAGEAGPELQVEAFDVAAPNRIEENGDAPAATTASVTVENCLSDNAVLYVNDNEVGEKPQGGTVQLADVPLGAEIKIVADENGTKSQSTVFFNDAGVTTLRFENYTPVDGEDDDATAIAKAATPEQVNQVLVTFYTSYLECINAQSMAPIQLSTERNNGNLSQRISNAANAANTYSFVSASCKADSIVAGEEGGVPSLKLNGTFEFSYAPRDDAANVQNGSNRQSVHLLYVDGKWVVDGFVFVEEADYNNNVIANF